MSSYIKLSVLTSSGFLQITLAHQVLSKDMAELVEAWKLATKYSTTVLDTDYNKQMQSASHVLAMDSKNLLDVIDEVRIQYGISKMVSIS